MTLPPIHSFVLYDELSPLYRLCIASFKAHGHKFILYTYNKNLKADCEVRDLREIYPEEKVFYYKQFGEGYKYGGITERINAAMLDTLGGWHVNMDVTCLKPFDFSLPYVFRPHKLGAVANIIRAEKKSLFTSYYRKWTETIDEHSTDYENSIKGLYPAIIFTDLQMSIQPPFRFGMDNDNYLFPLITNSGYVPDSRVYAVHWCGASGHAKNYEPNSFLDSLYKKYGIIQ